MITNYETIHVCRRVIVLSATIVNAQETSTPAVEVGGCWRHTLCSRQQKITTNQKFAASLIVSGDFRSFAASIETMDVLDEQLRVRLVLSRSGRKVHIGLGDLYAVARDFTRPQKKHFRSRVY